MVINLKKRNEMNSMNKTGMVALGIMMAVAATSCKNADNEFPDYDGGVTVYFANQYPARTVVLGEYPDGDNTLDNQHQVMIMATQAGAYKPKDIKINVAVDPSLAAGLTFPDGSPVKVMPDNYYSLESTTLTKKQDYLFGTVVNLTDAFFADPEAIKNTYVIPVRMLSQTGADQILSGTPVNPEGNPARTDASAWSVQPQDFVLYCVKYVNPWDASYLRRGVDDVTDAVEGKSRNVRHAQYVEKDEVVRLTTKSMSEIVFPLSTIVPDGESVKTLTCDLVLKFDGEGNVSISSSTQGMSASGTGKFVKLGDKNSFANQDRDVLYLDYNVDFGPRQFVTKDTLVVRSREIAPEFNFNPTYNN